MTYNPYVVGPPLRGEVGFYGRQDIIEWVKHELCNPNTNAIVLQGQRRIGKTSLLLQINRQLPSEQFFSIYFDLQDQATRPLGEMLADLADTLADEIGIEPQLANEFDDRGNFFVSSFLPQIYKQLATHMRLVFLFDEFDVLDTIVKSELPTSAARQAFFPFIRRLFEETRLAFVFVVGRNPEDMSQDFAATFKGALQREIWVLRPHAARELITQRGIETGLLFKETAIKRILALTNGHPYLTQLLGQRLWERHHKQPFYPVTDHSVDEEVIGALETGNQALVWLWEGLAPAERIYAAALAEEAQEGQVISEARVIQLLHQHAPRLRTREVELAPRDLVKRRVLEEVNKRMYRFAIELFRRWVELNRPIYQVKNEIDQLDQVAERYFQTGQQLFKINELQESLEQFYRAIIRNPRHFSAHLYLGEVFLKLEQVDKAVEILKRANQLDPDEAQYPLGRALLQQAKAYPPDKYRQALDIYEYILEFSPNEVQAQQGIKAIWLLQGDIALKKEKLHSALYAYYQINATDKIAIVTKKLKFKLIETIRDYADYEAWGKVVTVYKELKKLEPQNKNWQIGLEKAQEELWLKERYKEAINHIQERNWSAARGKLRSILIKRKNGYQDVLSLISDVETHLIENDSVQRLKRFEYFIIVLFCSLILYIVWFYFL